MDRLTALTEAAKLPGTIGIIHSRSNGGGGDEWAHPFIGGRNGEARLAYVANGSVGCFADRKLSFNVISNELLDEGYRLDSRIQIESDKYQSLHDGSKVHMSDVMAQLIARNLEQGNSGAKAMEAAFCTMPSEIVGLMLEPQAADHISYARINMPMMVSPMRSMAPILPARFLPSLRMAAMQSCCLQTPLDRSGGERWFPSR